MSLRHLKQSRGLVAPVLFIFLAGCSGQQVYQSSQGLRQGECDRIMDTAKREACMSEANKSWQEYNQDRKAPEQK